MVSWWRSNPWGVAAALAILVLGAPAQFAAGFGVWPSTAKPSPFNVIVGAAMVAVAVWMLWTMRRRARRLAALGTTRWFGASWGASVCAPATHIATPVGEPCLMGCGRPIGPDDQGLVFPHFSRGHGGELRGELRAQHLDCFLDSVGVGHRHESADE